MILLGLTGSIGMGKSTAAKQFRQLGIMVHDSDAAIHQLLKRHGKAVPAIKSVWPDVIKNGQVDRQKLGAKVFSDRNQLIKLEAILHPLVKIDKNDFTQRCQRQGRKIVVFDIPLLYETGADNFLDYVLVVTCPFFLQKQRVMRREGMTEKKFSGILARQMGNYEKCCRADFILQSGVGKRWGFVRIKKIIKLLLDNNA